MLSSIGHGQDFVFPAATRVAEIDGSRVALLRNRSPLAETGAPGAWLPDPQIRRVDTFEYR
jgi:hypothetical protein